MRFKGESPVIRLCMFRPDSPTSCCFVPLDWRAPYVSGIEFVYAFKFYHCTLPDFIPVIEFVVLSFISVNSRGRETWIWFALVTCRRVSLSLASALMFFLPTVSRLPAETGAVRLCVHSLPRLSLVGGWPSSARQRIIQPDFWGLWLGKDVCS